MSIAWLESKNSYLHAARLIAVSGIKDLVHQAAVIWSSQSVVHRSAPPARTLAMDMMDNASALPTCHSDNINSTQLIEIA